MYNENSVLVKTWVRLIKAGTYNRDKVPNLSNLQEVVFSILDKEA